jgi:hypothetical protein
LDEKSHAALEYSIAKFLLFFQGAFTWNDVIDMPLPTLYRWIEHANNLYREQETEIKKCTIKR